MQTDNQLKDNFTTESIIILYYIILYYYYYYYYYIVIETKPRTSFRTATPPRT